MNGENEWEIVGYLNREQKEWRFAFNGTTSKLTAEEISQIEKNLKVVVQLIHMSGLNVNLVKFSGTGIPDPEFT